VRQLFHREVGSGPSLIILHGLFGSSDNWVTIAKALSDTYKVITIDLRNHGKSFHDSAFTYEDMAMDVKEFIAINELEGTIVMGHSMGGKVAMHLATHYDLIDALIVVDISPKYYPVHHQTILLGLNSIDLDTLTSRKEADETLSKFIPEQGIRQFLLKNLTRNEGGKFFWKINLGTIQNKIENVGEALSPAFRFEKPTLFIGGAKSAYIRPSDWKSIESIFPGSKIIEIAGAGHWVHAEQPEQFVKIVREFLSGI